MGGKDKKIEVVATKGLLEKYDVAFFGAVL